MTELSLFDVLRPYLWLAAIAFAIGFAGHLVLGGQPEPTYAQVPAAPVVASSGQTA